VILQKVVVGLCTAGKIVLGLLLLMEVVAKRNKVVVCILEAKGTISSHL